MSKSPQINAVNTNLIMICDEVLIKLNSLECRTLMRRTSKVKTPAVAIALQLVRNEDGKVVSIKVAEGNKDGGSDVLIGQQSGFICGKTRVL